MAPYPFLRWVGGKARLVFVLRRFIPPLRADAVYYEPFVGAGSLFFALRPPRAVLADTNDALVECLTAVRKNPKAVWYHLNRLIRQTSKSAYYLARQRFNAMPASYERAALFIYLNKTCFNGIWRVNINGSFNVPFGARSAPAFPDFQKLSDAAMSLKTARLYCRDFEVVLLTAKRGDFVYLDPPYPPLNGTAYFTHYTKARFAVLDQHRVARAFLDLSRRGCNVLLTNADMPLIRSLYNRFHIHPISTQRYVAAHGNRYAVRDLAISNYQPVAVPALTLGKQRTR